MKKKPQEEVKYKYSRKGEDFRKLRTNIEFSAYDNNIRVLNVVSTIPNEGKSTISTGLAQTYADQYKNVLLIDCDLRKASVHKMLNISNAAGLSNLLMKFRGNENIKEMEECQLIENKGANPFYVITTGSKVPNPQELLASAKFRNFIRTAREQFSMIIIDCPPCLSVADAIPVCHVADGTLYVISTKDTNKGDIREGVTELQRNGANIIGTVLTKSDEKRQKSYYDYGYGE